MTKLLVVFCSCLTLVKPVHNISLFIYRQYNFDLDPTFLVTCFPLTVWCKGNEDVKRGKGNVRVPRTQKMILKICGKGLWNFEAGILIVYYTFRWHYTQGSNPIHIFIGRFDKMEFRNHDEKSVTKPRFEISAQHIQIFKMKCWFESVTRRFSTLFERLNWASFSPVCISELVVDVVSAVFLTKWVNIQ